MQKGQVSFVYPSPIPHPSSRPQSSIYHQNILRPPFSPPVRPITSSKIQTPPHLQKTIHAHNQNIKIMSPQREQQKKIDINLNIKVNPDETITVNANGQEFKPQQPVRVQPPPIGRPIMIPNKIHGGGFFVNQAPYHHRYYHHPPPPPAQQRLVGIKEQKNESVSKSSIRESSFQEEMVSTLKHEEKIYCVICEQEYSEHEKGEHIKKHQRRKNENKQFNVDEIIKSYDVVEEPVYRPIIQPQEYHIPYEPNYPINYSHQGQKVNQETTFPQQISQPFNTHQIDSSKRQKYFLDHEEEGIEDLDNSKYRASSIRKRVYDSDKYGSRIEKEPTRERVQLNEPQYDNGDSLNTRMINESSTRKRQYNSSSNYAYNPVSSKIPSHHSVENRYGQIRQEEEFAESSHNPQLKHSIPQSNISDVRSSQPRVIEPEVPMHEIIREKQKSMRSSYDEISMSKNGRMGSNAGTM